MVEIFSLMVICVLEGISLVIYVLEVISLVICVLEVISLVICVLEVISMVICVLEVISLVICISEEEEVSLEEDSCDWDLASVATLSTVSVMVVVLLTW